MEARGGLIWNPQSIVAVVKIGDLELKVASPQDLEEVCRRLKESLARPRCIYNSWYVRVPPERLLELLEYAYRRYSTGVINSTHVVYRFLEERGLARSLSRTITPTLSALGLTAGGKFTSVALEIGRLAGEGRSEELRQALHQVVSRNCVLAEVMEKAQGCEGLEGAAAAVLSAYGRGPRQDEVRYTVELLRLADPRCAECNFDCATVGMLARCRDRLAQLALTSSRDLLDRLDISVLPDHLELVKVGQDYLVTVRGTSKRIGMVLVSQAVEGAGVPAPLKEALLRLEEQIAEGIYEFYIKVIPIVEGHCRPLKAYIEVVRGDLERASKFLRPTAQPHAEPAGNSRTRG